MSLFHSILFLIFVAQAFSKGCTDSQIFVEGKDYFPYKVNLTYSNIYTITYYNTYVDVKYNYNGETIIYALVRCGLTPPKEYILIFPFITTYRYENVIYIPVADLTATDPTIYPILVKLDKIELIQATGFVDHISTNNIHSYIENEETKGHTIPVIQKYNKTSNDVFYDNDAILKVNNEVAFVTAQDWKDHSKIGNIFISEFNNELKVFGVVEFIKIVGIITGSEKLADEVFYKTLDTYNKYKEVVKNVTSPIPKVFVGRIYKDKENKEYWGALTPTSSMYQIFKDARLEYLGEEGVYRYSVEDGLKYVKQADIWMHYDYNITRSEELIAEDNRYGHIPALQKGDAWDTQLRIYENPDTHYLVNDFPESSGTNPDFVLQDIISIGYPLLLTEYNEEYFRQIKSLDPSTHIDWDDEETYPRNCKLSEWSEWSECSEKCGKGYKYRKRLIISPSFNGGRPCGDLEEKSECYKKCHDMALIISLPVVFGLIFIVVVVVLVFYIRKKIKNDVRQQLLGKDPKEVNQIVENLI